MKLKLASAVSLALLSANALAEEKKEDINYGDPTAVYKSVGVSVSNSNAVQGNLIYGAGKNVVMADLTSQYKDAKKGDGSKGINYRARYFYVNDGLGASVDLIGTHNQNIDSTQAVAGLMYKMQITDNFMFFPMLNAGVQQDKYKIPGSETYQTGIIQPAFFAMYAFDEGHWLYLNPRYTIATNKREEVLEGDKFDAGTLQIELGGGYMLNEWSALEVKVEHTVANKTVTLGQKQKDDTVGWLKYSIYF
ncbi:hypothetical protein [Paraferrimonas sedimenticola]|uniref:Uncharacterized protein n=1 Tax=Paraferrimonas sedimenticola TaxID=375674 RepID=A0AA37RV69_9GAMM|nr:hypothetical protein [Paraferrimonas sedimenticola]GLP96036.1 hypothetical protein GCM10007895_13420 [Paraferrimonas sedimenticola]